MEHHNTSDRPEISVIIPVYNVEKFIHACVESVLAQTFRNYEIILVDDGATDGCPAICDSYADNHAQIRVIHQKNGGLSAARNAGLAAARGAYVYFLDSDDLIVPSALEMLYGIAQREKAEAVFFEARVIDEAGRPIYHPDYTGFYNRTVEYSACRPGRQLFKDMLQNGDYLPAVPLIFMRREAVKHSFAPILHEDELFTPKLLYSIERACTCGEALYVRRVRAASITSERKTHCHFNGMATASRELMQYPLADHMLFKYAGSLAIAAYGIYAQLTKAEKKAAQGEKKLLIKELIRQHTPRTLLAAAFFTLPALYPLYKTVKRVLSGWNNG